MSNNISVASHQWATRPSDERFLSLADLKASVMKRKNESWTATTMTHELSVLPNGSDLALEVYDQTNDRKRQLTPSNFSFGQLSAYAKAPASYLRTLPGELAAINLQWGLEHNNARDSALVLAQSNGDNVLRAMTSTSYSRIWDSEVVQAVERVNQDGRWQVPAASYATTNPKRATTLYASDRDVFIFLVDPKNPISVGGKDLFRGFYVWNSEVGAAVFGLCTFIYEFICDNRTIWNVSEVKELRIRHTGGAPERFAYEGARYLKRYADESTKMIADGIVRAQNTDVPLNVGKGDTVESWLQKKGFTKAQAKASVDSAQAEQGQARSIWDIVRGITAHARSIVHTDERIKLEVAAGKLMEAVAA
jgi:hypothetical protein